MIRDIIRNNDYQKRSATKTDKLKRILKNYDWMSAKTRSALKALRFETTEDGKHYKISYYGDGRYQTPYSKTPSDGDRERTVRSRLSIWSSDHGLNWLDTVYLF